MHFPRKPSSSSLFGQSPKHVKHWQQSSARSCSEKPRYLREGVGTNGVKIRPASRASEGGGAGGSPAKGRA